MGRKRGVQYRAGSFYRSDDRSGFTRRADETKSEWNQLIVDENLWEIRQPQDFVRGVPDDQTVPNPRLVPPPTFTGPISAELSAFAPVRSTLIFLNALNGMSRLDPIGVMTNLGQYFYSHIVAIYPDIGAVLIADPLPYAADEGNVFTDFLTAVAPVIPAMNFAKPANSGYVTLIAGGC